MLKSVLVPIHREGWRFIAIFAAVTAVLFALFAPLGWIGVLATAWCVYFFRDPDRVTPVRDGLIVSPADGVVLPLAEVAPPPELGLEPTPRTRISIFMNVFDVHVNRAPCDAVVAGMRYVPGKFINASFDKASEDNERMALRLRMKDSAAEIGVVQIAGLVARRIKCYAAEGQNLAAGERFGIIRFGSRVDVYLPPGTIAAVAAGQRTIAGETVIADLRAQEPIRGEVR